MKTFNQEVLRVALLDARFRQSRRFTALKFPFGASGGTTQRNHFLARPGFVATIDQIPEFSIAARLTETNKARIAITSNFAGP